MILKFSKTGINNMNDKIYLAPTQEQGRDLILRNIKGNVVMLNLLKFKETADYSHSPELKPKEEISGKDAYDLYIKYTLPFLEESGGEVIFMGEGGKFLIGPTDEKWDAVLLVKQKSVESFIAFESHPEYQKIIGHRTAALEDSRLLPIIENKIGDNSVF